MHSWRKCPLGWGGGPRLTIKMYSSKIKCGYPPWYPLKLVNFFIAFKDIETLSICLPNPIFFLQNNLLLKFFLTEIYLLKHYKEKKVIIVNLQTFALIK